MAQRNKMAPTNKLVELAKKSVLTRRTWFAALPPDVQAELNEGREAVQRGEITTAQLYRATIDMYGDVVKRAHFGRWVRGEQ